jgi:3-hydroxyacyl-CoA dehydrogenase
MKPGAILASNTSTLDVNKIAAFTKRPQDVVGTALLQPGQRDEAAGSGARRATAKDVLATVMALAQEDPQDRGRLGRVRRLHRQPHDRAVQPPGRFPAGRRLHAAQVDKAIEKFGFAMGPFRMGDLAGNDIGWAIRKRRYVERADMKYSKTADLLCEMGASARRPVPAGTTTSPASATRSPSPVVVG